MNVIQNVNRALFVAATVSWLVTLWFAQTQGIAQARYGVIFLGFMIAIAVFDNLEETIEEEQWIHVGLLVLAGILGVVATAYMTLHYEALIYTRVGYAHTHEYVLAAGLMFTILYLTYKSYGLVFFLVVVLAFIYGMFGNYFPGLLNHGGFSGERLLLVTVLDMEGFVGTIHRIMASEVALFLLYAGLMRGYGAFDLILRAALRSTKYIKSGVGQAAVTASIIIGSITGSQAANTAITGSFTIPLMKEHGMRSDTAGGIESVASSGGQIMPPVMGAAAFVMASILGTTYLTVVIAGIIPALIFYISLVMAVHYTTVEQVGQAVEVDPSDYLDEAKTTQELLVQAARFIIPFIVLVYTLGVLQWTVMTAGMYTVITMLLTGFGVPLAQQAYEDSSQMRAETWDVVKQTAMGLKYGAITLAPIVIIVAAVNGIVDILTQTGLPGTMSLALIDLAGGNMALTVILAMVICILLGLGMPTVAAYIVVAFLIAPTLASQFLVDEMAAHYFVFYSAILSGLTPPIAIAVVVATGIAGSNFWRTCFEALKVSAVLFILPIAFIYNPELVIDGFTVETLISAGIAMAGALGVVHGLNTRSINMSMPPTMVMRGVFFVLGTTAIIFPENTVRVGALVGILVLYLFQTNNPFASQSMTAEASAEN
ncbi:TRAP transporter permease [Natronorubrum daqingense]|uniref:C4-dicarboxylate ABC transporter permease n=1 Tax=Natronorubrum daqingense TaxID=588898 RepID=A0A1N7ESQ7_9EURY|nr:TRAP transporter fused permease subunit [Natronorubrum daqingense]APX97739.1 C4-dicarboxylate ABC transporter permease [Natronorubrum daqingense]SIR91106.1 TRAP transporter, 4TM/12TM fusion protein [Natronorubrum daqingense]